MSDTPAEQPNFEGIEERTCGEHRTVGPHRAWCFDCSEWCYPEGPCHGCDPRIYTQAQLDAAVAAGRAAQRETDAKLAEHHNVRVDMGPLSDPPSVPFADLLRQDTS